MSRLLTTEEFAERAHTTAGTVRYWIHTGYAPPSAKIGRRRLFKEEDVVAWIDAQFDQEPA